ncbi:fructosamine kinase family protein [Alteribacillus sp. YIM 98480]|uniref:fructosamine kinase family protein n=1 Tax=Alteribacillus sp. YIM 98480 TaxID=2606599 RepID=UPI00131CB7AB|nr:fructosamine kinase family protein [Alteribacillus sp. YIM 98480]
MKTSIHRALTGAGINEKIESIQPVSGGSISAAYLVHTNSQSYFVKWHEEAPTDFFRQEALGLRFLEEAKDLFVPSIYGWGKKYIVMEPVIGTASIQTEEELGRAIASLHCSSGSFFGLEEDNFIGELPQVNDYEESWVAFLRDKRLQPQIELARSLGRMPKERNRKAHYILDHLNDWVPDHKHPVKLHGDLWGGNWLPGENGQPYFIDPAVWYGDHEFELAFTYLFGGFSKKVYDAYQEMKTIDVLFDERKALYQLYYLLVHLNIFGESYGRQVDRILTKYAK